MNRRRNQRNGFALALMLTGLALSGCRTVGNTAADLSLAGAGGVVGYQASDKKLGGAAAGAALGLIGSRVAQSEITRVQSEAEKLGYDRAMNQAVKQQYWIIQRQQQAREETGEGESRLVPVVVPETTINGVTQKAHVEYLHLQ